MYKYKQANTRSKHEQAVQDAFLKEYSRNGNNAIWAYDTLDYMIFTQYKDSFYALAEQEQWEVRDMMIALRKIYQ